MGEFIDKLDKINRSQTMHSHLVKWWDVNYVPGTEETLEYEEESSVEDTMEAIYEDAEAEEAGEPINLATAVIDDPELKEKLDSVLSQHDNTYAYDTAMEVVDSEEEERKRKLEEEANEIYMRLVREAQEDEAKKQAQIQEAMRQAQ